MEITGTIKQINPVQIGQTKAGKEWKKQEIILETEGQYPKTVAISLFNDKTNPQVAVGQSVTFSIEIESREYNGKYYTEAKGYKYSVDAPIF